MIRLTEILKIHLYLSLYWFNIFSYHRYHLYDRTATRLCVVNLRDAAVALGPVQPRELAFTPAAGSPSLDGSELLQFSGVAFVDAAPKPILQQPPVETHAHNEEGGVNSGGGGGTSDGHLRPPLQKIVFSARRRSSSGGHQQLQAGDTALYTSNVDGTEFSQVRVVCIRHK
jgi:hypothetical protein